jgi:hypothetical protein
LGQRKGQYPFSRPISPNRIQYLFTAVKCKSGYFQFQRFTQKPAPRFEAGYIDAGIIPKFAACESQGIVWFKERGLWQDPGYVPAPGDIIFFDWEQDGHSDHVGIVESVEGDVVHTVEGNTSNSVARRSYRLDSNSICGWGTPMYN